MSKMSKLAIDEMNREGELNTIKKLYSYVFHYNPYKDMWFAIPREKYVNYWNGNLEGILEDSSLIDLLKRL